MEKLSFVVVFDSEVLSIAAAVDYVLIWRLSARSLYMM